MCTFITLVLPATADQAAIQKLAEASGLGFAPYTNPMLVAQLLPGEFLASASRGHCDCGTALGACREVAKHLPGLPREAKSWSKAKVDRWLGQKAVAEKRRQGRALDKVVLLRWQAFLQEVAEMKPAKTIGMLKHEIDRGLEDSEIRIKRREIIRAEVVDPIFLSRISRDVLYVFQG